MPRPTTARTIRVILRARELIAALPLEQRFDGFVERTGVRQRGFELLHRAARPADQERGGAVEADAVGLLSVACHLAGERGVVAVARPFREFQARLFREALEVGFGDVARALFALLVVEELDVLPHLALLARCERGDLLGFEGFRFARARLQRAVFDAHLARAPPLLHDRGEGAERERLADRALQVAEVGERDGRSGAAEDIAALRDSTHDRVPRRDRRLRLVGLRCDLGGFGGAAARGGEHDHDRDDNHRDDHSHLGHARAANRLCGLGLLQRLALRARVLTALLAREVLLVALHRAHGRNFYRFLLKRG